MFNFFKKKNKCPTCKNELGERYVEGKYLKYCSEECREIRWKKVLKERAKASSKGKCGC